ncbi:hypothetical protein D3C87_2163990 [compost metagenome]
MHIEKLNPARALAGAAGSEMQSWAATHSEFNTTALALKRILSRVAVSPSVALVIAAHAGLLKEGR